MRAPTRRSLKQIGRHGIRAVSRCGNGRFFGVSFTAAPGEFVALAPKAEGRVEFLGNKLSGDHRLENGPGLKVEFGPAPKKE